MQKEWVTYIFYSIVILLSCFSPKSSQLSLIYAGQRWYISLLFLCKIRFAASHVFTEQTCLSRACHFRSHWVLFSLRKDKPRSAALPISFLSQSPHSTHPMPNQHSCSPPYPFSHWFPSLYPLPMSILCHFKVRCNCPSVVCGM